MENNKKESNGCLNVLGGLFLLVLFGLVGLIIYLGFTGQLREPPSEEEIKQKAIERLHGQHCVSAWDGRSWLANDAIKEQLLIPDSFKHIETRIYGRNLKKQHRLDVRFQSQNRLGLMVYQDAEVYINHEGCDVVSVRFVN